jgi:hypothetical protein
MYSGPLQALEETEQPFCSEIQLRKEINMNLLIKYSALKEAELIFCDKEQL